MTEAEVQARAVRQAVQVVNALRAGGWVFAAVVVWTRKDGDDGLAGASYFDLPKAYAGAMPTLADAVRTVAREIDDAHRALGAAEWPGDSYLHTVGGSAVDARANLARDRAVLEALGKIRLERRPDGKVRAADPSEAIRQTYELFELELARRGGGA